MYLSRWYDIVNFGHKLSNICFWNHVKRSHTNGDFSSYIPLDLSSITIVRTLFAPNNSLLKQSIVLRLASSVHFQLPIYDSLIALIKAQKQRQVEHNHRSYCGMYLVLNTKCIFNLLPSNKVILL